MLADGTRKLLEAGQQKTLSTDWVILAPGPTSEVKIVRQMFQLVTERGLQPATIARLLNERGLCNSSGQPWTHHSVTEVLTNPKYTGANVWGRTTARLHSNVRPVPKREWITKEEAFEAMIDRALFDRVQRRLARRTEHQTNDDLLEDLRKLWRKKGKLSQQLVALSDLTPSPCTYARRFGSLLNM